MGHYHFRLKKFACPQFCLQTEIKMVTQTNNHKDNLIPFLSVVQKRYNIKLLLSSRAFTEPSLEDCPFRNDFYSLLLGKFL